jgi:hypothetical protein
LKQSIVIGMCTYSCGFVRLRVGPKGPPTALIETCRSGFKEPLFTVFWLTFCSLAFFDDGIAGAVAYFGGAASYC